MRAGCGKGCRVGGGWGKGYPQRVYPQMVYPQMRTNVSQMGTNGLSTDFTDFTDSTDD